MKIDIVYVLGTGSKWDNNEIRHSLRSVEKNLKGYRNVFIVGNIPDWVQHVYDIEFRDLLQDNADGNIILKVITACNYPDLSEEFLLMADDSFILQPVNAREIEYMYKGDYPSLNKPGYFEANTWRKRLGRTLKTLHDQGRTSFHYDCHFPFRINKYLFRRIMMNVSFELGIGYTVKSMYGNLANVSPNRKLTNTQYTIFKEYDEKTINRRLENSRFLSVNDSGLNSTMKAWIQKRFSEKSKYEK